MSESPLRPHDYVECNMQAGDVYITVGLGRMLRGAEIPACLEMAKRGWEMGQELARAANALSAQKPPAEGSEEMHELTRVFWQMVLRGLPFSGASATRIAVAGWGTGGLCFAVGENGNLVVEPAPYLRACVYCFVGGLPSGPGHFINMTTDTAGIRAYILWLLRSSGIKIATPPEWPEVPETADPPNNIGCPAPTNNKA